MRNLILLFVAVGLTFSACSDGDQITNVIEPADTVYVTDTVYINMPPHELLKRLQCYEDWFEDYPLHPGQDCKEPPSCIGQ